MRSTYNNFTFILLLSCLFFWVPAVVAQQSLFIRKAGFKNVSVYRINEGDNLTYKMKGDLFYNKKRIILIRDSLIAFLDGTEINPAGLKKIRLSGMNHLAGTFRSAFTIAGVGFFALNTLNQVITDHRPILDEKAAVISVGLLTSALICRELTIKRIKLNNRNSVRVGELDFQHLNSAE